MVLRRIDALVAEHVMGIPKSRDRPGEWLTPEGNWLCDTEELPHYSSNIAAAWEVVEKLRDELAATFTLKAECSSDPIADFSWFEPNGEDGDFFRGAATAATAPLAICLAALKAKGVEVQS